MRKKIIVFILIILLGVAGLYLYKKYNSEEVSNNDVYYRVEDNVLYLRSKIANGYTLKEFSNVPSNLWDEIDQYNIEKVVIEEKISPLTCYHMFYNFISLKEIEGLQLLDTSYAESMEGMFYNCVWIKDIDLSSFDTSNVTSFANMFESCMRLNQITGLTDWNTSKVKSIANMFNNCISLQQIDLSNWNLENCTSASAMFRGDMYLESINVSNWNVPKLESTNSMFCTGEQNKWDDSHLEEIIGIETWNIQSLKNADSMFYSCGSLKNLDLSKWDVSKLENASHMFADCARLETLDTKGWNLQSLKSTDAMFNDCHNLKHIYGIENWNTSNVIEMCQTFERCYSLEFLTLDWDTSKVETFAQMFMDCTGLIKLDISSFSNESVTSERPSYYTRDPDYLGSGEVGYMSMFQNCKSLQQIITGDKWIHNPQLDNNMYSNCPARIN